MKKTENQRTLLDDQLTQLDHDLVWDERRQAKLHHRILSKLDKQESVKRFSGGFKLASSFMLFMIILVAGYLFISENLGTDSANPGNDTETAPAVTGDQGSAAAGSEEAIRAVIEKEFDGPDEKYKELLDAAMDAQISEEYMEDYEAYLESPEYQALMGYMEETYAAYFTEGGYEEFINVMHAFMYSGFNHDYNLAATDIEIEEIEGRPSVYDLSFQVEYRNGNNETSYHDFEGTAAVSEEGKIVKIEYLDGLEDGLLQKLKDNEEE